MWCYNRMLKVSWNEQRENEQVLKDIRADTQPLKNIFFK